MKRIQSFDIARGFTVLLMPSIHVAMLYSKLEIQQSWLGKILAFIAEGPGAQLFMLLMGVSFLMSTHINKEYVLKRSLLLIIAAYTLNTAKFIIPLFLGWMPQKLLTELNLENNYTAYPFFFLLGDILHFAAIAFPILFLVYKLKHFQYWSIVIAIAVIIVSPFVWDSKTGIKDIDYVLTLLGGHPPNAFFPVFPWLAYPLIGLTLGYYIKKNETTIVLNIAGLIGIILIIASCLSPYTTHPSPDYLPFYRTEAPDTVFHVGFVLVWLCCIHWLTKIIPANPFFRLLTFCSKNITLIYIIQWIIICWGMKLSDYMQLRMEATLIYMIVVTLITLILTKTFPYARTKNNL